MPSRIASEEGSFDAELTLSYTQIEASQLYLVGIDREVWTPGLVEHDLRLTWGRPGGDRLSEGFGSSGVVRFEGGDREKPHSPDAPVYQCAHVLGRLPACDLPEQDDEVAPQFKEASASRVCLSSRLGEANHDIKLRAHVVTGRVNRRSWGDSTPSGLGLRV